MCARTGRMAFARVLSLLAVAALSSGSSVAQLLSQAGWSVVADSEEVTRSSSPATNAIDGDTGTLWHTQYGSAKPPYPHNLTISLGGSFSLTELRYTPRQDRSNNGNIGRYEVYTRIGSGAFPVQPAASGEFADNGNVKAVALDIAEATEVLFLALSEAGGRGPWACAAEVNLAGAAVTGALSPTPPPPSPPPPGGTGVLSQAAWSITADSEELRRGNHPASNAIDGDDTTFWHTDWSSARPAYPHSLTIELGGNFRLTELLYTPRQDRSKNGNIGGYEVFTRVAGGAFGAQPDASGIFNDNKATQSVPVGVANATAVLLLATSEAGDRGPWASAAEINLVGAPATAPDPGPPPGPAEDEIRPLSPDAWTVTADSEQGNRPATNAIDGVESTIWHTQYQPVVDPLPHQLTIDLGGTFHLTELRYLPRQGGGLNGNIGDYEVFVRGPGGPGFAADPVATGTFEDDSTLKTVRLDVEDVAAVRLVALTEAGGRGQWTAAAEVGLSGCTGTCADVPPVPSPDTPPVTPPPPPGSADPRLPRDGWFAMTDSYEQGRYEETIPSNAIDGDNNTVWHTRDEGRRFPFPHELIITLGNWRYSTTGLDYLPPQDEALEGNVGRFEIYTSADGSSFGSQPVAEGEWENTAALKTAAWPAVTAKAIKLVVLSNAPNDGPWAAAAEVWVRGTVVAAPAYATEGAWGPLERAPLVPVGVAALPNGKVVTWSAYSGRNFGGRSGFTQTSVYTPDSGSTPRFQMQNTNHDMFCPGITMLGSGEVVITGGSNAEKTTIYKPNSGDGVWEPGPDMNIGRGYHSSALLSTGEVFVVGGSWSGGLDNKSAEIYTPGGTWELLSGIDEHVIDTEDKGGIYRADNHAWLFGWSNGEVFQAGPSVQMNWFGTAGSGSNRVAGQRPGLDAMNGNAVMYDSGKILTFGGAIDYRDNRAVPNTVLITITGTTVSTRTVAAMAHARSFANGVVLPDGKVVVIGGQEVPKPFKDTTAVLVPELWDPTTEEWTQGAPMGAQRTYHSTAVLLADGRVYSGGGGLCGTCATNHFDSQLWTPPALLTASGDPRARPSITVSVSAAANGADITVDSSDALSIISIIRYGSATHAVNTDQRRIELCGPVAGACGAGPSYTVTIPADPGIALPGPWMVFGVGTNGAYSVGENLTIGSVPAALPPPTTAGTAATSRQAATAVSFTAPPDAITTADGTAAPVDRSYSVAPIAPEVPMPPGTQMD